MSDAKVTSARRRGARQKAQTRAALIRAAQQLIAEDRTGVAILEITKVADVALGSFYNHFESREQLFDAAIEDALEVHGAVLDEWTGAVADPAEVFAQGFRLTGRLHRLEPRLSRVMLSRGAALVLSDRGIAPRALRDIRQANAAGRFRVADPEAALLIAGGAALTLAEMIHSDPARDDAALTDRVAEDLLRMLGLTDEDAAAICRSPLPDIQAFLAQVSPFTRPGP